LSTVVRGTRQTTPEQLPGWQTRVRSRLARPLLLLASAVYETRRHPPISSRLFIGRVLRHLLVALALVVVSLAVGMAGYEHFEGLPWRDAFLNTAMIAGGMGPVDAPRTNPGKVFAGLYALYSGLVFIFTAGLLLAPFVHRVMHKFHWERDR
jgi:hypothetical protein